MIRILFISLFLFSCAATRTILDAERPATFQHLKLKEVIDLESKLHSVDNTHDYYIGISTGIYPNTRNFRLAIPRTYVRNEGYFKNEVSYYFSESDSSVKVILYEWTQTTEPIKLKMNEARNSIDFRNSGMTLSGS